MNKSIFVLFLAAILVACCGRDPIIGQMATSQAQVLAEIATRVAQPSQTPFQLSVTAVVSPTIQPVCVSSTPTVVPSFGLEMHFPGNIVGPAIAELWNSSTGFCALVKVNQGESLNWPFSGSWWQGVNSDVLNIRFSSHAEEYLAKGGNASCKVFTSAKDVSQP